MIGGGGDDLTISLARCHVEPEFCKKEIKPASEFRNARAQFPVRPFDSCCCTLLTIGGETFVDTERAILSNLTSGIIELGASMDVEGR